MTARRTHEDYAENLAAYALGALPELEARVFERHLMGCESCQAGLERVSPAVEALPRAVTQYEPPASLKESLMEVVNAEAERARHREGTAWRWRWRPAFPRVRPGIAGAAAAVVVMSGVAGYGVSELARDESPGARTVAAEVDLQRLPEASASLLIPRNDGRGALLRVQGLPDPGRDRIYQVWVQRGGEVAPVSIFDVDSRGAGAAAVPESVEDVTAVMVTRERRGGAKAPTEAPLLRVEV